jgi:hypothetical protein
MNEVASIAKATAAQSAQDVNYLPILLLFIGIGGGVWMFKWIMKRLEQQTDLLAGLCKEANDCRVKIAGIVTENTMQSRECTQQMRDNTEFLRQVKEHFYAVRQNQNQQQPR